MKIRHWSRWCVILFGLANGTSSLTAPIEDPPSASLQGPDSGACNRVSDQQLNDIRLHLDFIETKLSSISDSQAADAGLASAMTIQSALALGCRDQLEAAFTDLRDRPLGSEGAAFEIWRVANHVLANIATERRAFDRAETISIAAAEEIVRRWKHPPADAAEFYFRAVGANLGAGYTNNDTQAFDRALAIANERILPLADKQATPAIWFRVHFLIGDLLLGKTTKPQPGETIVGLAKQAIAATQAALLVDGQDDMGLFMAQVNLAAACSVASSNAGFADQSLNDLTVTTTGKVLSDSRLTPDMFHWGYLHDNYARATLTRARQMQNPERERRINDALAAVETGLAKLDRDRNLLTWARLQFDRAVAHDMLATDRQNEKTEALRNLDLAIKADAAILDAEKQIVASGGKDIVDGARTHHRDALAIKAEMSSPE